MNVSQAFLLKTVNEHLVAACLWEIHLNYKERKFMAFTTLTTKSATAEPWEKEQIKLWPSSLIYFVSSSVVRYPLFSWSRTSNAFIIWSSGAGLYLKTKTKRKQDGFKSAACSYRHFYFLKPQPVFSSSRLTFPAFFSTFLAK